MPGEDSHLSGQRACRRTGSASPRRTSARFSEARPLVPVGQRIPERDPAAGWAALLQFRIFAFCFL